LQGIIIFTDLDGSLLNEDDYSFAGAAPALARIGRLGIPLIIATSKTRPEIEALQRELAISAPFIAENGGGIFFPAADRQRAIARGGRGSGSGAVIPLGVPYAEIRAFLAGLPDALRVRGFGDLTEQELAALAGLTPAQAALAKQRDFTEPFLLEDAAVLPRLEGRAVQAGLQVVRGGRFHHLIGAGQDKGRAVRIVREIYRERDGRQATAIGLGDSENDLPLLAAVDIPVLIPRPDGSSPEVRLPGLIRALEPGSRGWNGAVERLLAEFEVPALPE
jgi:mannosyl-3-phosphoglycerate phosphatase